MLMGFTGLMESYTPAQSKEELLERLSFLVVYNAEWQRIRGLISQRNAPNSSIPCVCGSRRRIGRCHKLALKGSSLEGRQEEVSRLTALGTARVVL